MKCRQLSTECICIQCGLPSTCAQDLTRNILPSSERNIARIVKMFENLGWKDTHAPATGAIIEKKIFPIDKQIIAIFPSILTYTDNNKKWCQKIWYKCRIEVNKLRGTLEVDRIAAVMKEFFKDEKFFYKPFKDEDAYKQHFSRLETLSEIEISFYLNPHYPDGYWCNHTL